MSRNVKLANVLDALADHFDKIEAEKASGVKAARDAQLDDLAAKYASAYGEELPVEARTKLAESDATVVALLRSMAEKQAAEIEPLGGPSHRNDESVPLTKKEAAAAADARFGNWLTSS